MRWRKIAFKNPVEEPKSKHSRLSQLIQNNDKFKKEVKAANHKVD